MKDMGLSYKKVVHIPLGANSERSMVLRQQWAVTFLKQNPEKKVILNLDEVSNSLKSLIFFLYRLGWACQISAE